MAIRLRNDFHNTSVTLRPAADGTLSAGQVARAKRTLCPRARAGCTCGGNLGERGPQEQQLEFVPRRDGRWDVIDVGL